MGINNSMYGKCHTEEWKQEASKRLSKKVQCIETGEIFNSRKEAAIWAGLKNGSGIADNIAGRKKSAGKHPITHEKLHWKNMEE